MYVKLNSPLQTKNLLGLDGEVLKELYMDPHYNFLRVPAAETLTASRGGEIIVLEPKVDLNIHRDYLGLIMPNPQLHEFGIVSYNVLVAGEARPALYVRAHKAGELELDYVYDIRLAGNR